LLWNFLLQLHSHFFFLICLNRLCICGSNLIDHIV
jgi:hypothetical protein